jgi:hypothetical protein
MTGDFGGEWKVISMRKRVIRGSINFDTVNPGAELMA